MENIEIDMGDFQKWAISKPIIVETDMEELVQQEARETVVSGIEKASGATGLNVEKACKFIKDTMDRQYGPYWHWIIGQGFSFDVTRQAKATMYMYYAGNLAILLFKC